MPIPIRPAAIGALVPLTRPGWVDAGRHLLAGLELAVHDVNDAGGIGGRPLELVVRDTAADPHRAAAAVDELAGLGGDSAAIPFLRYLPEHLGPLGARVEAALRERLAEAPSFVAFEGYDTVAVLADVLRAHGTDRVGTAESWPRVTVEGTRGQIQFSRTPGISVWQWAWTPIQVADRDPNEPNRFRILHAS
jgi:hypothetical protein